MAGAIYLSIDPSNPWGIVSEDGGATPTAWYENEFIPVGTRLGEIVGIDKTLSGATAYLRFATVAGSPANAGGRYGIEQEGGKWYLTVGPTAWDFETRNVHTSIALQWYDPARLTVDDDVTFFAYLNDISPTVSIDPVSADKDEGNSGTTAYTFVITRDFDDGAFANETIVHWTVTGADASDFAGGVYPSGAVTFTAGEMSRTITVNVNGDTTPEGDEGFTVTLTAGVDDNATVSTTKGSATGTIRNDDVATPAIGFSGTTTVTKAEGNSGTTAYTYVVTRDITTGPSTVVWTVSGSGTNQAAAGDFGGTSYPSGTVTFADGQSSATITVNVSGDTATEHDEEFTVTLSNGTGGTVSGTTTAKGIITNDDAPTIGFSGTTTVSHNEGNSGTTAYTYVITRDTSSGSSTVVWTVSGSGTNSATADDFGGSSYPSGTVTFAAGETAKTITVNVSGDTTPENNEEFTVTLSNGTNGTVGGTTTAKGIITNDEVPSIGFASTAVVTKAEGNSGTTAYTYVVTRDTSSGTSTVVWTVSGSGTNSAVASDFGGTSYPSGTVTFADGQSAATITVNVSGDATTEHDEEFTVTLSNGTNGTVSGTTTNKGVITNDDAPTIGFSGTTTVSHAEGNSGTTAYTYVVTRDTSSGSSTVVWTVSGSGTNSATADDFGGSSYPSGTVTFAAGETAKTITVNVSGDTTPENNEEFTVTLSNGTNGTVGGTTTAKGIITNDEVPSIGFASTAVVTKAEGNSGTTAYTYVVTRDTSSGTSTVVWTVSGSGTNSAVASDFGGTSYPSGTVTFADGQSAATITVNVSGDATTEHDEEFTVTLSNGTNGTVSGTTTNKGVITNDDAPTIGFAGTATVSHAEGNAGTTAYTYVVTRDTSSGTSTVVWTVSGSGTNSAAAGDFGGSSYPSGTVTFAAGQTAATITVNVSGDTATEHDEEFTVTLSNGTNGTVGGTTTNKGVITNDDAATIGFSGTTAVTKAEGNAGTTAYTYVVTRDTSSGTSTVVWTVSGSGTNSAAAGDFGGSSYPSGTVTFAAGQTAATITVNVSGDTTPEHDEEFTVTLSNGTNGTVGGTTTATGVITNDDTATIGFSGTTTVTKTEGNAGTTAYTYVITRNTTAGDSTVVWTVGGSGTSSATADDFGGTYPSGTVTFADGQSSATITVNVTGDATDEPTEEFTVTLSNGTNGTVGGTTTAKGIITNDDSATPPTPSINFGTASVTHDEGAGGTTTAYTYVITRDTTSGTSTVVWTVGGSGTNSASGSDFAGSAYPSGTVTFSEGQDSATITVMVNGDDTNEPTEEFTVTLSNGTGGTVGGSGTATGVITNDDAPPAGTPSVGFTGTTTVTKAEGNAGTTAYTYVVTRTGTSGESTVVWNVTGSGANAASDGDFAGGARPSGTVTFADGQSTATITVNVRGDGDVEPTEEFTVTLTAGTNVTVGGTATAKGIITNDDAMVVPNTAPKDVVLNVNGGKVDEYTAPGVQVGAFSGFDAEGDAISYTIVDSAGGRFSIVDGKLMLAGPVNYEEAKSHQIKVRVSDGKEAFEQVFTINVGDQVTLNKRGSSKNDKLNGTGLDDILKGGSGNGKDQIKGLNGDDKLYGEGGNDTIYGGNGHDTLYGGKNDDTLKGDGGNDILYGEEGNDKLYGGAGKDIFVFNKKLNAKTNLDTIADFKVVDDTIWLDNAIFKKLGKAGSAAAPAALNKDFFRIGDKAKDRNDYIIYDKKKGILYYDADGSGKGKAVEIAKIGKNLKMTADDFSVI
ncbi:hypothetical protein MHY87_06055 [Microvirga sp. ACRRW]|uniref:Calx-beta domain-containing protein n=1 Tax=Microvirga sp. ACRRW TaxID=2918205 RepID=UPI001EF4912C|nr:Calx-beta domain-containing protein [Microvirga sp. ACRRW]MCG7392463.1 hypothetical protein [Microvirga sp. ACRRW]